MKLSAYVLAFAVLAACGNPSAVAQKDDIPASGAVERCPVISPEASAFMDQVAIDLVDPDSGFSHFAIMGSPELAEKQAQEAELKRMDWGNLCKYEKANAAVSGSEPPKVVFMGDSITEFWSAGDPGLFEPGMVNRGISGQTSSQMLVRFWPDVIALNPDVVHIMAGTNDLAENTGYVTDEAFKANIKAMVTLAQANGIAVILASIPPAEKFGWRPDIDPPSRIASLNAWLEQYAAETGAVYVDYHTLLSDDGTRMSPDLTPDGVHPNSLGYDAIRPAANAAIAEALEQ